MISKEILCEMQGITQELFLFGEECASLMLCEDTQQREFDAISVDLAARFSFLAEYISLLADGIGSSDYADRFEAAPKLVSTAAKKYLSPLSWSGK